MTLVAQTLKSSQGDDFSFNVNVANDDNVNLTGATASWIMAAYNSVNAQIYVTKTNLDITFNTDGSLIINVDLLSADTLNVPPGNWYHEGRLVVGSKKYRFTFGRYILDPTTIR